MLNYTCSHPPQSDAMQVLVRWPGSSQGTPPYWLGCRTLLKEACWPIPQLAEQGLHWDQLDHRQSTARGHNMRKIIVSSFIHSFIRLKNDLNHCCVIRFNCNTDKAYIFGTFLLTITILGSTHTYSNIQSFYEAMRGCTFQLSAQYYLSAFWPLLGPYGVACLWNKRLHYCLYKLWMTGLLPFLRQLV